MPLALTHMLAVAPNSASHDRNYLRQRVKDKLFELYFTIYIAAAMTAPPMASSTAQKKKSANRKVLMKKKQKTKNKKKQPQAEEKRYLDQPLTK